MHESHMAPVPNGNMEAMIQAAAERAASLALAAHRDSMKKGRRDEGSGDPVVGAILRKYREDDGATLEQLAAAAGIHPTFLSKIEKGERGMSLATFCKLARVLDAEWVEETVDQINGIEAW